MDKKRRKIMKLLKEYQKEFNNGNNQYLLDYIGINVILSMSYSSVCNKDIISAYLIENCILARFMGLELLHDIKNTEHKYKVPSIFYLDETIKNSGNCFGISVKTERTIAAEWLKLMINANLIKVGDVIDLTKIELINFINDPRLVKILCIEEEKAEQRLLVDSKFIVSNNEYNNVKKKVKIRKKVRTI